jgi:ABC-2 type transport system ATP-binding protein
MTSVVRVTNLNLTYRVLKNRTGSLKELLRDTIKGRVRIQNYIALKNISFEVKGGEVLAIVGGNGAGKSTLLKVLARVLPPTTGVAEVRGSIAPMIELGAGFHPEMTGSENIVFYSALLGRRVKSTKSRIHEITEWAGVTDHKDFPLRTFSSGMIARLAFATATDQRADLILIDEVLSVGDNNFRDKSRARILEMISVGAAVVLVSHDLSTIRQLAHRVLWLEKGEIRKLGNVEEVLEEYERT